MAEALSAEDISSNPKASHPFIGLLLSVVSALLVGGSFILQKKGLLRSTSKHQAGKIPLLLRNSVALKSCRVKSSIVFKFGTRVLKYLVFIFVSFQR